MGFVIVNSVAVTLTALANAFVWRKSRGATRWRYSARVLLASVFCCALSALVFAACALMVEGYLVEPIRFIVIFAVFCAPASLFICLAFLLVGPRKYPQGCCEKCGYCLFGLASEYCPECGRRNHAQREDRGALMNRGHGSCDAE